MRLPVDTSDGVFTAHYSERGLKALDFPSSKRDVRTTESPSPQVRNWHAQTTRALKAMLAGRAPGELPPLDLSEGTDFQQRVWNALRRIAPGKTRSYSEIAESLGEPGAARAVGGACGANPIPVLVPCHRVLAAHHRLGGFSGGLDWKVTLLKREGVEPAGNGPDADPNQLEFGSVLAKRYAGVS
jgi:O-6-methylguanine DNA methyltransferase